MSTIRFVMVLLFLSIVSSAFAASYRDPHGKYRFDLPMGWNVTALEGGDAIVSEGGGAYVRIVNVPGGGKNQALVKRVTDQIGMQWQNFKQNSRGSATLAGQQGIFVFFTGINPKGVPAILRVVAAPFGEDAFLLLMSAPNADFVKAQEAFKQIEFSFAVGEEAKNAPKPEQNDPTVAEDKQTVDVPGGGHILQGMLKEVSSGPSAFKSGLGRTRGYFDTSLNLLSVVRGKDNDNLSMATFTAVRGGSPVGGLVISVYDPAGASRFAVLYDAPEHLGKSLPTLLKRFDANTQEMVEQVRSAGGKGGVDFAGFEQASKGVALRHVDFPDGTASIGVAPGFTPSSMGGGRFTAASADGSYINLYVPCPILDPNSDLYKKMRAIGRNGGGGPQILGQVVLAHIDDPAAAWKAYLAERARQQRNSNPDPQILNHTVLENTAPGWHGQIVTGTITWHGEPFVFTGTLLVSPPPGPDGSWMLQVTMLGAPAARAAADMPAMIAMQHSEKVDLQAVADQTMRNIARINEQTANWLRTNKAAYDAASQRRYGSAKANAHANREAMDKSTAAFIDHISDQSVLAFEPNGAHGRLDKNLASALEQADPQHFRVIPAKEYIPGKDY